MKNKSTHITVILDRTGSMEAIRDDTIGGFNAFLEEQKKQPGQASMTLVQFDSQDPYEVLQDFSPISEVPELTRETYIPRASTPLLDALGRGINELESALNKLDEKQRPQKVILAIITDGQENASQEFRRDQIVKMIKEQREEHAWQFVFLSADLNSIRDASDYGFQPASALAYSKTGQGVRAAFDALSARTADYRASRRERLDFEAEDRKHPDDPNRHSL